jgi:hypothetical protein
MALNSDVNLNLFLTSCLCQKHNEQYTHVDIIRQKHYNITTDKYQEFMLTLCEAVDNGNYHSIAEKPIDSIPVIAQVRLKYESQPDTGYTESFVNNLIYIYQTTMMELLEIMDNNNPMEMICFMLEMDTSSGDSDYLHTRDGYEYQFNLHFPYCRLEKTTLQYFQTKIREKIIRFNLPGMLSMLTINNPQDIIKWNYYEVPMIMYGGVINKNDRPLTGIKCYGCIDLPSLQDGSVAPIEDIGDYIEYEYYSRVYNGIFGVDVFADVSKKLVWLPILFSNDFMQKVTIAKPRQMPRNIAYVEDTTIVREDVEAYDHLINNILPLLNDIRYVNQCYWKDIGKGLYHISRGRQDALNEWYRITVDAKNRIKSGRSRVSSDKAYLINPDLCEEIWETFYEFGTDGITDKTIRWYAREDNRTEYDAVMRPIYEQFYDRALTLKGEDVANAFYNRYMFDFMYEPGAGKSGLWWSYERHTWVIDKEHMKLMDRMSKEFVQSLNSYLTRLTSLSTQVNGVEHQDIQNKVRELNKLIGNFKEDSFMERITRSLKRKYRVENFDKVRDENIRLTVCNNGVIEVFPDSKTFDDYSFFRNGKPEDFCTLNTHNNFPTDSSKMLFKDRLQQLDRFFEQLFVKLPKEKYDNKGLAKDYLNDPSRRLKLWMACWRATFLIGNNEQKIMVDLYGKTHTGKSQFVKLIFLMFGDYTIKGNNKLTIYNSRDMGGDGPSASKARQRGRRGVCYDEMSSRAPVDSAFFKRETGGDSANKRDLFEKGTDMTDMKQQHKIFCTYNKYPPVNDADDEAFWDRKRVVCFKTKFLPDNHKDIPQTPEEQRLKRIYVRDPNFEQTLRQLSSVALWVAFHDYKVYADNFIKGMPECVEITNATSAYRMVADYYMDFIEYGLEKSPGSNISCSRMYKHFTFWYGLRFPKSRPPSEIDFRQAMDNKGYTPENFNYYGFVPKSLESLKGEDETEETE